MTDPIDLKIRSVVATLIESAPLPPRLPTLGARPSRSKTRRVAVGFTLVVVIAAAMYIAVRQSSDKTTVTAGPGASTGNQLIVVDDGSARTTVIDVDTRVTRTARLPHRAGGDFPYAILVTGGYFAYVGDGGTWATPTDLAGSPRNLGSATYIVPSSTPGRVWLVTTTASGRTVPATVQEVGVDGHYRSRRYRVPRGYGVITGADGAVMLDTGRGALLWYPNTGRLGTEVLGPTRSTVVDVRGSMVAWGTECSSVSICSTVHVTDLATGRTRDYATPQRTSGWVTTAGQGSRDAFSTDGRYLAMRAATDSRGSEVYVIELATGATSVVPTSMASSPYSRVAWLRDSNTIVSQLNDGAVQTYNIDDHAIQAFPATSGAVAILTLRT